MLRSIPFQLVTFSFTGVSSRVNGDSARLAVDNTEVCAIRNEVMEVVSHCDLMG